MVAEQLKAAIDEYVASVQKDFPTLEPPLAEPSPA